jgi:hypothetical protein
LVGTVNCPTCTPPMPFLIFIYARLKNNKIKIKCYSIHLRQYRDHCWLHSNHYIFIIVQSNHYVSWVRVGVIWNNCQLFIISCVICQVCQVSVPSNTSLSVWTV